MVFEDRQSTYPNRYLMTDASGGTSYVFLERADDPIVLGTPLNAKTFNDMQAEIRCEDKDYPGCDYFIEGTQKIWINPPMLIAKAYTTSERFLGKRVNVIPLIFTLSESEKEIFPFASLLNIGSLLFSVVNICGTIANINNGNYYPLNCFGEESEGEVYPKKIRTYIQENKLVVEHPAWMCSYELRIKIKYTLG